MSPPEPDFKPQDFIPLSAPVFHILVSLAGQERHGYSIMQDVAHRTDGAIRLSPGTLYGSIRRLLEEGWILESGERPDAAHDDERRRYYRLTARGHTIAVAEIERLERVLSQARASGLAPQKGTPT